MTTKDITARLAALRVEQAAIESKIEVCIRLLRQRGVSGEQEVQDGDEDLEG